MLHPLPLPLSSCLGCIPPLIGLPSLRFYAVGSSLFLLSVCFCLCSLFYRDDVLCWLLLARPFLYAFHAHLRFPVDLVWFRLSCDHGWIRSGSVNVRKQQQQLIPTPTHMKRSEKNNQTSPSLRRILTASSVRRIQTSPSMSANTLQIRLTLLEPLILKLYAYVIQSPVLYYQVIKKKILSPLGRNPPLYCTLILIAMHSHQS